MCHLEEFSVSVEQKRLAASRRFSKVAEHKSEDVINCSWWLGTVQKNLDKTQGDISNKKQPGLGILQHYKD